MFQLNPQEHSKLVHMAGDKTFVEALRKLFLNEFLSDKVNDVQFLAASKLSINYLQSAFRVWENLKENKQKMPEIRNVV